MEEKNKTPREENKQVAFQKHVFFVLGVVLVVLIALSTLGYFLTKNTTSKATDTVSSEQSGGQEGQPTALILQETANMKTWKTYTDEMNNFSLRYPSEYKAIKQGSSTVMLKKDPAKVILYLHIERNSNNLDVRDWLKSLNSLERDPLLRTHDMSNIMINSDRGLQLAQKKETQGYKKYIVLLSHNKKIYYFNFRPPAEDYFLSQQILSTFKFIK